MPDTDDGGTEKQGSERKANANSNILRSSYNKAFRNKAGAWTAFFTCVLSLFSYLLWNVTEVANQTAQATQAASLSSFGPAVAKIPSEDGKTLKGYNFFFTWVNNGTTPSRTATMQANVEVGSILPTKELDFNNLQQSKITVAVLGPKAGIQMPPNFVSLEDMEDIAQNKKHMFLWGWAVYHDIFSGTSRLSEYCFDVQNVNWTKPRHSALATDITITDPPCGVHFCFNEECEDYKTRTK